MSKPSTSSGSAAPAIDGDGDVEVQVVTGESTTTTEKPKATKRARDPKSPKEPKPKKAKKEYKLDDFVPKVKLYEEPGVWPIMCPKCKSDQFRVDCKFVQTGKATTKPHIQFIMKCKNDHKIEVEPEENVD